MPRRFTLLELLLVLVILGILSASVAVLVSSGADEESHRNNQSRLDQIQIAICGDHGTLNSRNPVVSGFLADMGRLPNSLSELLNAPLTPGTASTSSWNSVLQTGWRGPYLQIPVGISEFRDAWGNVGSADDASNFGWVYPLASSIATLNGSGGTLTVGSNGKDGISGGTGYDADTSINLSDSACRIPLNALKIRVAFDATFSSYSTSNFASKTTIRLAFITDANANLTWPSGTANGILASDWVSEVVTMPASAPTSLASSLTFFNFINAKKLPWGRRNPVFIDTARSGTLLKDKIIPVSSSDSRPIVVPQSPMLVFPRGTPLTNETLMFTAP
ncbi:MAG: hypothetical protein RL095_3006 [Verrucomicrobiota bacterium]